MKWIFSDYIVPLMYTTYHHLANTFKYIQYNWYSEDVRYTGMWMKFKSEYKNLSAVFVIFSV